MSSPSRPAVGVAVIIRNDRQILLGWRVSGHGANSWQLPGGHLEYGEDVIACGLREVAEESGLKLTNAHIGPYTNDVFVEAGKHYITLYVIADYVGGQPEALEPTKCARWQWFAWDALPHPLFLPMSNLHAMQYEPFGLS